MKFNTNNKGFTFIEILIYVSLVSIFVTSAVLFAWDIIYAQIRSTDQLEVGQNIRLASKRIAYEIKNSSEVVQIGDDWIELASNSSSYNPTIISLIDERLYIAYGTSGICPISSPCALTSNKVKVTNVDFTDQSSGSRENIRFSLTVEKDTVNNKLEEITYSSSIKVRSN